MALIAFATVSARGVLDGTDFGSTVVSGLQIGAAIFITGLIIGDFARRLIDDVVQAEVQRILDQSQSTPRDDNTEFNTQPAAA